MNTSVSVTDFIQAQSKMLCLCLGMVLLLLGPAVESHAVQPEAGLFSLGLDQLSNKFASPDTGQAPVYHLSTRDGFIETAETAPVRSNLDGTSRWPVSIRPEHGSFRPASIRQHLATGWERASFSSHLHVESKQNLFGMKPRYQSVWMVWRRPLD